MTHPNPTPICGEILPPLWQPAIEDENGRRGARSEIVAAGVVHDLGNLIQIASSALSIIARTPNMPAVHAGPMLDRAKSCLDQAGALVRQDLRRLRDPADFEERVNVAACLADICTIVDAINQPGMVLEVDVEPQSPEVRCDPIGLRRAILNLVLNAQDAMAGKGKVVIRTRTILPEGDGAVMDIQVIDRGVGMSPETIARVFDPSFTTRKNGLGGIGLPMVERFAQAAGGRVSIASELGAGTVVTLRLPAIVSSRSPIKDPQ